MASASIVLIGAGSSSFGTGTVAGIEAELGLDLLRRQHSVDLGHRLLQGWSSPGVRVRARVHAPEVALRPGHEDADGRRAREPAPHRPRGVRPATGHH